MYVKNIYFLKTKVEFEAHESRWINMGELRVLISVFSYTHFTVLLCDVDELRSKQIRKNEKKIPVRNSILECSQKRDYTFIALKMSFVKHETLYVFFVGWSITGYYIAWCRLLFFYCFFFTNGYLLFSFLNLNFLFPWKYRIFLFQNNLSSIRHT